MANVFISVKDVNLKDIKWIDARFSLQDPAAGKRKFAEEHIAGAVHWDLEEDLSDMTKSSGRHPMPDKSALTALFQKSGLNLADKIVVYDDGGSPFAARAWWLLKYAGFKNAFIALEGFEEIVKEGIAVSKEMSNPVQTDMTPVWDETIYADRQLVKDIVLGEREGKLLDARSAERYMGKVEPIDPIAGRIPGALNLDWEQLKEQGKFCLNADVSSKLSEVANPGEPITVYCGSGVTAAPLYAMLAEHGYDNIRLYVGSYSDWISTVEMMVERG
ncbi:sulfurtransferase [Sporosarcina sp. HYO08]|uniref:sulfurtransferase n=1 Tax=Sporosarcina sp. HYO08 TaxID=1759557 RepID=UPI000799D0E0|nr:sulfurtransferase [Sporosarcina sp. HYO08]KXH81970.1 thiosulfate sulfurtransferase [Sporosarcina sp. HYO08]